MYEYKEVSFNDLLQRVDVRLIFGNDNRFSAFKRYFTIELPSGVTPRLRLYICRLRRYDWLKHRIGFKGELEFNGFDAIFIEMWQNLPEVIRSIDSDILENGGSDPNNTSITTVFFTTEEWKREFFRLFDKSLLIG
ncbi:MAG: hypothetical protein K6G36_00470 [Candidatus Saccharibacteria bacterium]|nr:hypothetical protein [Candidatus Saccharibacteria bacterium]